MRAIFVAPEVVKTLQPMLPFLIGRHGRTSSACCYMLPAQAGRVKTSKAGTRCRWIIQLSRSTWKWEHVCMQYRIELRYWHGWDDACWSEEINGETRPMRFQNIEEAEVAINEFFAGVRAAVAAGDMD